MYSRVVNQSAQLCLLMEQYTWHIINIEWNSVSKIHSRRPSVIRNIANTECQYQYNSKTVKKRKRVIIVHVNDIKKIVFLLCMN